MFCLRDFDLVEAFRKPNLFRLYSETIYSIRQRLSVEEHVSNHIVNSNYDHQGDKISAELYEWSDLTDAVDDYDRYEHEMGHALLSIVCEVEGWHPFFADGNHEAEAFVIEIERCFEFWHQNLDSTKPVRSKDGYLHAVNLYYDRSYDRDEGSFALGWQAAHESETPLTAFEARFLGIKPLKDFIDIEPEVGEVNKWGERVPAFLLDEERALVFLEKMLLVRERMIASIKVHNVDYKDKAVCGDFFRTLKMDELAAVISGENPNQIFTIDKSRVRCLAPKTPVPSCAAA